METYNITIRGLTKSYGAKTVFTDLNLRFESGKSYCLMAPSGAGKTTLFRIIMGLEKADAGSIEGIKGKRLSIVFQESRLLEGYSAEQNLRFVAGGGYSLSSGELTVLLKRLLPEANLSTRVGAFSGGMKRCVEILRAILVPADIFLMDEPFSGMDDGMKRRAADIIRERTNGKLLIIASHLKSDADLLGAEIIGRLD